jgi:hypothetical protein
MRASWQEKYRSSLAATISLADRLYRPSPYGHRNAGSSVCRLHGLADTLRDIANRPVIA